MPVRASASSFPRGVYVLAGVSVIFALVMVAIFFRLTITPPLPSPPDDALYRQASASIEERVEDLLARMTLEEKVGQLALVDKNSVARVSDLATYGLGALLSGAGARPSENTADGWAAMVGDFTAVSKTSRLGIPILYGVDAIHGHSNVPGATVFPHAIGLGATRDAALVEAVAAATARELIATNVTWTYSPTLDLPQDIRWGRTYEAFSDDPSLVAELGAAYVRGTHGAVVSHLSVLSTPKHYTGVGAMQWGTARNENYQIDQGITVPSEEALRTQYLPPFAAALEAGARSVMVGLNSWGDTKLAGSHYLITEVLKRDLGFTGFTVSDWYGVYEIPGSNYDATVTALNAGIDMVMLPFDYKPFIRNVARAVRHGEVPLERLDDAVRRVLRVKFELGLFDEGRPSVPLSEVGSETHRALAREAVASSLVLLQNKNRVLPLTTSVSRIRVAGSAADNVGRQAGAWTVEWQGIDGNWLPNSTSILAGIRARVGQRTIVEYDEQANFVDGDVLADIGIAVVGESPYAEGWGDRALPVLTSEDLDTIKKLQATSRQVIVILISGRPLFVTNEINSWDAVVAAWLPGSEGAGVADVLFGDRPFVGVLPLPWPRYTEQLPISADGTTANNTPVLFPRYYGLRQ